MCSRAGITLLAIFASLASIGASSSWADTTPTVGAEVASHFDLPAEPLDKALRDFALQAKCNISYEPTIVAGLQSPAISGNFTVGDVLSLLLKSTKLKAVNVNDNTIQILERPRSTSRDAVSVSSESHATTGTRTGPAESNVAASGAPPLHSQNIRSAGGATDSDGDKDIEEITVTGTHIRGTKDSPSPVQVYTRADIDATGMITIQQFLQTLTANFGGASENTISQLAGRSRTNNLVNGSAPNLRGLGAEATLVLINGHRVAPGNYDGSFVDISMIPLAAVDRIEILTDGASAIYGSDAVGGVVNIILRSKFDGAESRAVFGAVGTGSMHNVQASQTVGESWQTGSAVLSYQYSDQTPLSAGSRDYLHSVALPFYLLPEQVQQAAFADLDQEVAPGFDLHGDANYSHRGTNSVVSQYDPSAGYTSIEQTPTVIDSYSASLGATVALPRESKLATVATYSETDTSQQVYETPPADQPLLLVSKTKSALISLDVNLDGILAALPAGFAHYAVGAQYRRESYGMTYDYPPTDNTFYPSRNVGAGYLELHIPLVGPDTGSHGDPTLELTVADRAEHYSDFGSTNNPQLGAIWKPASGWAIRGTYGTSFKAPILSELNPVPDVVVLLPGSTFNSVPGGAPNPNALFVLGGNPSLKPEKATVWTVGLDFKPDEVAGLSAKLTFYDIAFRDEIGTARSSVNPLDLFLDASILGPQIVQRNPPYALIQQLISAPSYVNPFNLSTTSLAILDNRDLNLSTVKTRGLDFATDYKTNLLNSSIDTGIDGTYIFTYDNQFSSSAPVTSFLNTAYNPTDLRLRGKAVASLGALSAGVYVNFVSAYKDTNMVPNGHVASWTTTDAVVTYQFESAEAKSNGVSVSFAVTNLTNRNPPYIADSAQYGITYDGVNANALGRFFSLRLQKHW